MYRASYRRLHESSTLLNSWRNTVLNASRLFRQLSEWLMRVAVYVLWMVNCSRPYWHSVLDLDRMMDAGSVRQKTTVRCCVKQRLFLGHVNDISSSLWFEVRCKFTSAIVYCSSKRGPQYEAIRHENSNTSVALCSYIHTNMYNWKYPYGVHDLSLIYIPAMDPVLYGKNNGFTALRMQTKSTAIVPPHRRNHTFVPLCNIKTSIVPFSL